MATIVNNPPSTSDSGSSAGMIAGILIAVLLVVLLIMYGLPLLRNAAAPQRAGGSEGGVNVQVPDKIDVNVQKPE